MRALDSIRKPSENSLRFTRGQVALYPFRRVPPTNESVVPVASPKSATCLPEGFVRDHLSLT